MRKRNWFLVCVILAMIVLIPGQVTLAGRKPGDPCPAEGCSGSLRVSKSDESGHTLMCDTCSLTISEEHSSSDGWSHNESSHFKTCDICKAKYAAEKHSGGTATCTQKAKCSVCGAEYGSAMGHTGGTATCKNKAVCTRCNESYGSVNSDNHTNIVTDPAVDATCSSPGKTAGKHCSDCGAVLEAQKKVPVKEHTAVTDTEAIPATCTTPGKTAQKHCSVCGTVLEAQKEIPAKGHTVVTDDAVEATCTSPGKTAGNHCSDCGAVLEAQEEIPALGHTGGTATCKKKAVCTRCKEPYGSVDPDNHTKIVKDPAVEATCTSPGKTAGKHCSACEKVLEGQKKIPAKGHTKSKAVTENKKKATCTTGASHERVVYCKICGDELSRKTVKDSNKLGHNYTNYQYNNDATCVKRGTKTRKCTRCGRKQTETDSNHPALGHKFDYTPNTIDGTLTGTLTGKCSRCGVTETVGGITASTNGETIIIPPGENVISKLKKEPDPESDNPVFVAAYQYGRPFASGTIDFSNTPFANADSVRVVVVLLNKEFRQSFLYTVAFSDGTVSSAGCVEEGMLKISVPRKAKDLGYVVMISIPSSIKGDGTENSETTLADLMRKQYETLAADSMELLKQETKSNISESSYKSFKEGYISLRMQGRTHEEAYENIKNQFISQSDDDYNGDPFFIPMTRDQSGNYRYCNSDQYGCWVTTDDGGKNYIMFWSEENRELFMGKDKSAVVCPPPEDNGRMMELEPASTKEESVPLPVPVPAEDKAESQSSPEKANPLPAMEKAD